MCIMWMPGVLEGLKKAAHPLELAFQMLGASVWALGTERRFLQEQPELLIPSKLLSS